MKEKNAKNLTCANGGRSISRKKESSKRGGGGFCAFRKKFFGAEEIAMQEKAYL